MRMKLAQVGLEGACHLLPAELSGGMKTSVALARAMVLDPELLLCRRALGRPRPGDRRRPGPAAAGSARHHAHHPGGGDPRAAEHRGHRRSRGHGGGRAPGLRRLAGRGPPVPAAGGA
ncbi:MAG: hypothetical protein MZV63_37415 [Marinilabiliales bacterium]|nr:hypothetical protein [Marinilabiliales bacterium]